MTHNLRLLWLTPVVSLMTLLLVLAAALGKTQAQDTAQNTATPVIGMTPLALFTAQGDAAATGSIPMTPIGTLPPTPTPSNTPTPSATFTPSPTPTPAPFVDHYSLGRPISERGVNVIDRVYPYGGTQRGAFQVHSGVEFVNPRFTPVQAADDGVIFYAGSDTETVFGPYGNYYGNVIVIDHGYRLPEGERLFTLYGHLEDIDVATGEVVEAGQVIGRVGATGIAIGSHLHFEVRVEDPFDFMGATRNPDLYLVPQPESAMLVGKVVDTNGDMLANVPVQLRRAGSGGRATYETFTYGGDPAQSSPMWDENFTRGDVRPGEYEVFVQTLYGQTVFRETVTLSSENATYIVIELPTGLVFSPDLNSSPADETELYDLPTATPTATLTPTVTPDDTTPGSTDDEQSFG